MIRILPASGLTILLLTTLTMALGGCAGPATPAAATLAPATEALTATPAATEVLPGATENLGWHNVMADGLLKIAMVHVNPITDGGWSQAHHDAILAAVKQFGGKVQLVGEVESVPYSPEATRTIEQFITDGARMIFVDSEYADLLYPVVQAHPDVIFEECDGHKWADNLVYYYYPAAYGEYMEGVAAGNLTKSKKIGFIGSFPTYVSNITAYDAFTMGVRSVVPDARVHVVNINSWFDPAAERQANEALYAEGVDYIASYVASPDVIAFGEEKGIWTSLGGYNFVNYGPHSYVGGSLENWTGAYIREIQMAIDGSWTGNRWWLLPFGPDNYYMVPWGPAVPKDIVAKLDDVYKKLSTGEFNPFVGPIKDNTGVVRFKEGEVMTDMYRYEDWNWPVEGVVVSEVSK